MQRKAFIQLTEAAEQVPAEVPRPRQRVTYLLDSMKTVDPKVLVGIAAIEDELGKQSDFELSFTFLLPSCPVAAKNVKAKGLGVNVSSSDVTVPKAGIVTKGSTGVELRWHEPNKFKLLTKEKRSSLQLGTSLILRRMVTRRNASLVGQMPSSPKLIMS